MTHPLRFKYSWVVTKAFKIVTWGVLIFVNLFFVYFCLLRAMFRDQGWQYSYLMACFLQLIVEIFFYESFECLWIYYAIPRLVAEEVEKTLNQIRDTIDEAFTQELDPHSANVLDAPSYFFVSSNLAEIFPHTFESEIVSVYRSIYPAPGGYVHSFRQVDKEESYSHFRENQIWDFLKRFGFTAFLISFLGILPIRIQKLLIHVLQPILLAFFLLSWAHISSSLLLTVLTCMALIMTGMLFVRWLLTKRRSPPRTSNPRRSSQRNSYESFRNGTMDALHHPSFSIPSNDNEESKDVESCVEQPNLGNDQPPLLLETEDHTLAVPHRPNTIVEKSDEEKGDPDLESFDYDSKGENAIDQSSSLDHSSLDSSFPDPYELISSDGDGPLDDCDLSASSDGFSSSSSSEL